MAGRRKIPDALLAKRTPEQQYETLRKREQRARKHAELAAAQSKVVKFPASDVLSDPMMPAKPPPGIESDQRAQDIYAIIKRKLQAAGLWNDEAVHGPLMLYCKCVVAVEQAEDVRLLPAAVMVNVSKLHAQLKLDSLPAERVRKESKFGGNWG